MLTEVGRDTDFYNKLAVQNTKATCNQDCLVGVVIAIWSRFFYFRDCYFAMDCANHLTKHVDYRASSNSMISKCYF